jgi:hypothetical protein
MTKSQNLNPSKPHNATRNPDELNLLKTATEARSRSDKPKTPIYPAPSMHTVTPGTEEILFRTNNDRIVTNGIVVLFLVPTTTFQST